MRYYIKTVFVLPNTVEETKEILAQYYKDICWDDDEINEMLSFIKTWEDVKNFLDTYDNDEFPDLVPYFEVEYGRELTEEE